MWHFGLSSCQLQSSILLLVTASVQTILTILLVDMFACWMNCREQHDADGRLIWRGLRVRVGMSYGFVNNKKPLNTGRADYFGVLPNGAARVSALAAPGQVRCYAEYLGRMRTVDRVACTCLHIGGFAQDTAGMSCKVCLRAVF